MERVKVAMLAHGLTHILTFNGRNFRRFVPEGLSSQNPQMSLRCQIEKEST